VNVLAPGIVQKEKGEKKKKHGTKLLEMGTCPGAEKTASWAEAIPKGEKAGSLGTNRRDRRKGQGGASSRRRISNRDIKSSDRHQGGKKEEGPNA